MSRSEAWTPTRAPTLPPTTTATTPASPASAAGSPAASIAVGRDADAELAIRLTGLGPQDHVVDVGCGPGVALEHAARVGATVTGIDPATVMLRMARRRTRRSRGVELREGRAEALPLPDGSATVVWSLATVHHWPDLDGGLDEVHRVLAARRPVPRRRAADHPGATGLASHGWTPDQAEAFADLTRAHGFTDVRVEQHPSARRRRAAAMPSPSSPSGRDGGHTPMNRRASRRQKGNTWGEPTVDAG